MSSVRNGAPLTTHSSRMKDHSNLWFVLLNRAKDVVFESSLTLRIRPYILKKSPLKGTNGGGDHCYHL